MDAMIAQPCPRCKRLDCSRAAGQRSEAAYESCLMYTAARAEHLECRLERADGMFRSADLELNDLKKKLSQALIEIDVLRADKKESNG